MKTNAYTTTVRLPLTLSLLTGLLILITVSTGLAADRQVLRQSVPPAVNQLTPLHRTSRWNRLDLTVGLPWRNHDALTNLLQQIYDPASTNYHRYLTPQEFAERFGPTEADYQAVVTFAQAHGLTVTARHSNRALLNVRGTVATIERAFNVTLNEYQHPSEARTFYAPNVPPSLDLATPVLNISGLDNYMVPRPCLTTVTLTNQPRPQLTGSGPSGYFLGYDFRHAYAPGSPLTGLGQTVGLVEFDGYYPSDVAAYEALAGLPNVPVNTVLLDGFNGIPGSANDEVSLDIDMAIAMAPGLAQVIVYEGNSPDDVLNRIATDKIAKQISASWTYSIDATTIQIFQEFAAQGQSFYNASGDSGAYPGTPSPPTDNPYVTTVGGTDLTTVSGGGAWVSEAAWPYSSGGISTTYSIPSWQQGINMTTNQGSTIFRNLPDVAMIADNCWLIANNGQNLTVGGTSIAAPLWAGFTALMNQLALTNGEPTVGFINPAIYAMGKGSNFMSYNSLFHDIATGNNENASSPTRFSAVPGYDLCTGWGTPTGSNLMSALALPEPLRITPGSGAIITGPVGGPFSPTYLTYTLTNSAAGSLNWSLIYTSSWLNATPTTGTLRSGGLAATVTASLLSNATNFPAGTYVADFQFTNQSDNFVQNRFITLAVVTSPMITAQPTNQSVLAGTTATFTVGTVSNALLYYQWEDNGTNLTDSSNISGSSTSKLTITNVTSINVGSYSVIISNAAGMTFSSNALLAITASPPVLVTQPTNEMVLPGAQASFSVAAVGDRPYYYQWQFNSTNLSNGPNIFGATNAMLLISNVSSLNAGTYSVNVSNHLGVTASTGAVLSVVSVTAPGLTMSTLWSFTDGNSGQYIFSPLTQGKDGFLYGTTLEGGTSGLGTVFKVSTNGSLTTLLSFNNNNGAIAYGGLIQGKDGYFYGTTYEGGAYGYGTIFKISPSGSLITLVSFNGENGMLPVAGLIQGLDGNLYGTTLEGGVYGYGTVFKVTTSGTLTTLVSFNYSDGGYPSCVLVQGADGNFYGTTENGGSTGNGTIFRVSPTGSFSLLYSFTGGSDGAIPIPGLAIGADGNFYGNTITAGENGYGTIFQFTLAGVLNTLYSFTNGNDGANPWGGLMLSGDGNLYGTTQAGGSYGYGTAFQIAPNGPLNTIVQFDGYNGASPSAAIIKGADGNLYGTTYQGGSLGDGTIFKLSIGGALQITGQPADQSAYLGGNAQFTVATFGGGPVSYQWQQNGINLADGGNISGSSTATLSLTNVTVNDAAFYSVVVSNSVNSLISDYAVLEISLSPPRITSQPVSLNRVVGTTAAFNVKVTGDLPLVYQWQKNGTNLIDTGNVYGSNSNILTIPNLTLSNAGSYSVVVSNSLYSISSSKATLVVVPITAPSAAVATLRQFSGGNDGAFPFAGMIQGRDGNLYGSTVEGGSTFQGTVFRLYLGGGLVTLYTFTGATDGAKPYGQLVQSANGNFYGTTFQAGTNGYGTIYRMTLQGLVTAPFSFTGGADGGDAYAGLIQATDGNFYGTAFEGGLDSFGTIYKMATNGAVIGLYQFSDGYDGAYPYAGLVQGTDGNLYGTTVEGGAFGYGTAFCQATNGLLTTLVSFNGANGANPEAGLIQAIDGRFYGTTYQGGSNGFGTVFSLTTNGTLTTLFSFNSTNGANPIGTLMHGNDGNLYGSTSTGGPGGQGSIFKMTTNGILSSLVWFDGLNGANPQGTLLQANNGYFYGTTPFGGTGFNPSAGGGNGVIFRMTVPVFITNSFTAASAIGSLPYSANISTSAIAPPGDTLSFAKVSGPAWLTVGTNGLLSGTSTNSDIGTNIFIVSLTDTNGVTAFATMRIVVTQDPPPSFVVSPFTEPFANVDEDYSGTIATNAIDLELPYGDGLTFAKVSGPAWLNVGTDGTLSGTPQGIDGGTNIFVVSVVNFGGLSNTATMFLYVNSPPYFMAHTFTKIAATVGIPYSGTIATNATDPDLGAGEVLTFYKAGGPAWLNVAANGALSGTPTTSEVGANSFLMLVVDSGGLAAVGTLNLTVNADRPPVFAINPFIEPHADAGLAYFGTIATNAADPDFGDLVTMAKVSGPAWLNVAANGVLSGMPMAPDAGTNAFLVSATDLNGLSNSATMFITVAGPIYLSIVQKGGQIVLNWTGGYPPFQVQTTTNLGYHAWSNLGSAISSNSVMLMPSNNATYFRVQGQ